MSIPRFVTRRRLFPALVLVLSLAGGAAAVRAAAQSQPMPKSVTVGTNPAGTVYFALASGIAKVVSGGAGHQMVVPPHARASNKLPLIKTREIEIRIQHSLGPCLAEP